MGGIIGPSRLSFWLLLLSTLFTAACGRDTVGRGLTVNVISELRSTDPFSGEIKSTRQPAVAATVFLVSASATRPATGDTVGKWPRRSVDRNGTAHFKDVEGQFRALVDGDGDGAIDAVGSAVDSGGTVTVVLITALDQVENTLTVTLGSDTYHRGDTVSLTLAGKLAEEKPVGIEIWRDDVPRVKVATLPAKLFSGTVSHTTTFEIGAEWPLTLASSLDDYLVVPVVQGTYFTGDRFSLREVPPSFVITNMSVTINGGDTVTNVRNVTLTPTADNAATMSFSENPFDFDGGALPQYPISGSFAWQLSAGDGAKTVWAMFYDADGNFAGPVSDSIVLDSQPVIFITDMTVVINAGDPVTTSRNVSLSLTATNAAYMAFSEDPASFPSAVIKYPFGTEAPFSLSTGDGVKTVWVMYYDIYGRYGDPVSDTIVLDTRPASPVTNMSLSINGGVTTTTNRNVTLTLGATGAVLMAVTENPALLPDGLTQYLYAPSIGFQLSDGDGPKIVWAMFYDAYNHYYGPVSATIELDAIPPEVSGMSLTINGGAAQTTERNVSLSVTADNAFAMAIAENPALFPNGVTRYAYQANFGYRVSDAIGIKTVWVMFYDQAGNYAGPVSDQIYYDPQPAVPITNLSVLINGGATSTVDRNVTLALSAENAVSMAISDTPVFPGNVTRYAFQTNFGYRVSDAVGTKTVWVMFYDQWGNYAGPVSDQIDYDPAPVISITNMSVVINGDFPATNDRNVTLDITASNAVFMAIAENPDLFPDNVTRYTFQSSFGYRVSSPVGKKIVWVGFYDEFGHYAGAVSDAIDYDPQPAVPITNMSVVINGGANETNDRNVLLTFTAENAAFMAISENPALFPDNVVRYGFQSNLGFQMSVTEGTKTIWVMFFDQWGNAAAPVSDTVEFDTRPPFAPVAELMYVIPFAPGMHDFLAGYPGAVSGGNIVRVYSDIFLTVLLGEGIADADGSFGPIDIGDGSAGNVFKPQDWVFVTATNIYDTTSAPTIMINDSTPPELREMDIQGMWWIDTLGMDYGNTSDSLRAFYIVPTDFAPATDAVGGRVDFSNLGGPVNTTMVTSSTEFAAFFTVPVSLFMDENGLALRMQIHDAAFNSSAWVESETHTFNVDTIAPSAAFIPANQHDGGNQTIDVQWREYNIDTANYYVIATSETGQELGFNIDTLSYCNGSGNTTRACLIQQFGFDLGGGFGLYNGRYPLAVLPNCHTYDVMVQVVDDAGNLSPFSNSISDATSIPPPVFSNWSGLMEGGAMIAFSVEAVVNATAYELDFSTATGAPYTYEPPPPALFYSPITHAPEANQSFITRFWGLPTNTTFYVSARSIDASSDTCFSEYATEVTTRTELVVRAFSDGATRETVGGSLAAIRDLNGDAIGDLLVGAPFPQYVATVSGGTGEVLSTFGTYWAPDSYDIPGTPIATAELDNAVPGRDEYIVGSPLETVNGELLAGQVRIYDRDQNLVKEFTGAGLGYPVNEGMQLGFSVANVGDQNSDGYHEFAMGGFNCAHRNCGYVVNVTDATEGPGRVILVNGATLSAKAFLEGNPPTKGDYYGIAIAGGKDVGGSSAPDFAVGAPGSGYVLPAKQVIVYDGTSLSPRFQLTLETEVGTYRPGAALAFIDDISNDGKADLIIGVPSILATVSGYVQAVNSNGGFLWRQYGSVVNAGSAFGTVLATGGDVNGDGVPDIVVGAPLGQQDFFYGAGSAYVLDGRTGRYLYEFHGWGDNGGFDGSVGQSALIPGNLILGPRAEWVVGAPGSAYSGYQSGRIYILSTDP